MTSFVGKCTASISLNSKPNTTNAVSSYHHTIRGSTAKAWKLRIAQNSAWLTIIVYGIDHPNIVILRTVPIAHGFHSIICIVRERRIDTIYPFSAISLRIQFCQTELNIWIWCHRFENVASIDGILIGTTEILVEYANLVLYLLLGNILWAAHVNNVKNHRNYAWATGTLFFPCQTLGLCLGSGANKFVVLLDEWRISVQCLLEVFLKSAPMGGLWERNGGDKK